MGGHNSENKCGEGTLLSCKQRKKENSFQLRSQPQKIMQWFDWNMQKYLCDGIVLFYNIVNESEQKITILDICVFITES